MKFFQFLVLVPLAFLICGCASSYYKPGGGGDYGYYDRRINESTYEVSYKGTKWVSPTMAYDFAILRALEIGKTLGYEFMLLESTKDVATSRKSRNCVAHKGKLTEGTWECAEYMTFTSTSPGYTVKVRYFEQLPSTRYLPEKLFPIRVSYLNLRHEYGLDK